MSERPSELPDGSLLGPDGIVYRATPQRLRRRAQCSALMDAGAPLVTNVFPEGLVWHGGAGARAAWNEIAPRLVSARRPDPRDLQWVGHLWESDAGAPLLRFDGEH